MIVPDTSVLIAGANPGHVHFTVAVAALDEVRDDGVLVAHTLAETFAVLTAAAYRHDTAHVRAYLGRFLSRAAIGITPDRYPVAMGRLDDVGVVGAAVYDGLIALGAQEADATLVSLDHRAAPTYERCEVEYRLLGD